MLKDLPHTLKKHGGLFYMLSLVKVFHNLQCSKGMNVLFAIFCEATYTLVYVSIVQTPYLNLYHGLLHCLIDLLERDGVTTKQQIYIIGSHWNVV
jgi:hypothetical protein